MTATTQAIVVNPGTTRETTQVVKPLLENGRGKTLVAFIQGANVATKWIKSDRIFTV